MPGRGACQGRRDTGSEARGAPAVLELTTTPEENGAQVDLPPIGQPEARIHKFQEETQENEREKT